jgi:hypothetical protein
MGLKPEFFKNFVPYTYYIPNIRFKLHRPKPSSTPISAWYSPIVARLDRHYSQQNNYETEISN